MTAKAVIIYVKNMIDLHNHSLFDVDDGCHLLETSLQTIREEAEFVDDIFLTPHIDLANFNYEKINHNYEILLEEVKKENINVNLHLGGEISPAFYPSEALKKSIDITMGHNSDYILIGCEFESVFSENQFNNVIYDIQIMGKKPILAHPERMHYFRTNPDLLLKYINQGCLLQLNGPSLYGKYGEECEEFAKKILKLGWISFLGSDNHRPHGYSVMKKSYDIVCQLTSPENAKILCEDNPRNIIKNVKIYNNDFQDWVEEKKEKKSFFSKFFKK